MQHNKGCSSSVTFIFNKCEKWLWSKHWCRTASLFLTIPSPYPVHFTCTSFSFGCISFSPELSDTNSEKWLITERLGVQEASRGSYCAESKQSDFMMQSTSLPNNAWHVVVYQLPQSLRPASWLLWYRKGSENKEFARFYRFNLQSWKETYKQ